MKGVKTVEYMRVPPKIWCRIYGTRLEVFNPTDGDVRVTSNLAGIGGLKLRLSKSAVWGPGTMVVQIYQKEVNSDDE